MGFAFAKIQTVLVVMNQVAAGRLRDSNRLCCLYTRQVSWIIYIFITGSPVVLQLSVLLSCISLNTTPCLKKSIKHNILVV